MSEDDFYLLREFSFRLLKTSHHHHTDTVAQRKDSNRSTAPPKMVAGYPIPLLKFVSQHQHRLLPLLLGPGMLSLFEFIGGIAKKIIFDYVSQRLPVCGRHEPIRFAFWRRFIGSPIVLCSPPALPLRMRVFSSFAAQNIQYKLSHLDYTSSDVFFMVNFFGRQFLALIIGRCSDNAFTIWRKPDYSIPFCRCPLRNLPRCTKC
jgi:hypothetical protein